LLSIIFAFSWNLYYYPEVKIMSKICAITGKKANIQRTRKHDSTKSRSGSRAFAYDGPNASRAPKRLKRQDLNLVTVRTPIGKMKVSMKVYKTYFKTAWVSEAAK
jgi:ribosomal protein L28